MSLLTKLLALTASAVRAQSTLDPSDPGFPCKQEGGEYRLAEYNAAGEHVQTTPMVLIDFKFFPNSDFSDGGGYCKCYDNNGMNVATMPYPAFKCVNRNE